MPAALSAPIRHEAAKATLELPFAIPAKEWFSLGEAAALSGMSESYVEKKYDEGTELSGHNHNGGAALRATKRIPRVWLVRWLIATAQYDDPSLADALISALRRLPAASLLRVASAATKFATEK